MSNLVPLKSGGPIAGIIPQNVEEVFRLAQAVSISGLAPKDLNTPEKIMVAIMTGLEIGLPPMFSMNKIAVINGRPTVWGDAVPALLWAKGFKIREWADADTSYCEVTRPDGTLIERSFSNLDAKKAGLANKSGPWTQYPERMRAMRARGYACRDGAADVLGGLYFREEIEDEPKRKSSSGAKKDGTDKTFNALRAEIADALNAEHLQHIRNTYSDDWDQMPARWVEILNDEYDDKMQSFAATQEAAE